MLRQPAALVLLLLLAAPDCALAHGGSLRGPDGSTTPRFGGPAGVPQSRPRPGHRPDFTHDWEWWWDSNAALLLSSRVGAAHAMAASRRAESRFANPESSPDPSVIRLTRSLIRNRALPFVRLGTRDPYFDCRAASVIALGKLADPDLAAADPGVLAEMRKVLSDPDKEVRESACLGLGLVGDPSQIPDLLLMLKDDPNARVLAGFGPEKSVLRRLRGFAALAVGLIGMKRDLDDAVVAHLVRAVENADEPADVRVLAAIALGAVRNRSPVPALRAFATSAEGDALVRAHAIVALARLGDRELVTWLVKSGLRDKSDHVQRSSAIAMGLLARADDEPTIDALIMHAKSSADRSVRNFSMIALGRIGGEKPVAFLLERLARGQPHDRTFGALALGDYGARNPDRKPEIAGALLRGLSEIKSDHERGAFAIGLGLLGWRPAVPVLIEALKTRLFAQLDGHVATALGLLGATEAAPQIRQIAKASEDAVSSAAARRALGFLGEGGDVALLVELIRQNGYDLPALGGAAVGLGFTPDLRAVAPLGEALSKPDDFRDNARAFAAVALGCLGDKDEVPLLASLRAHVNYLAGTEGLRELFRIY